MDELADLVREGYFQVHERWSRRLKAAETICLGGTLRMDGSGQ